MNLNDDFSLRAVSRAAGTTGPVRIDTRRSPWRPGLVPGEAA
jgi:hypothetical protein